MEECEHCMGTGQESPNCEECEGNGWVYDDEDGGTKTCPTCRNEQCFYCEGTGEMD